MPVVGFLHQGTPEDNPFTTAAMASSVGGTSMPSSLADEVIE
jgi:hypothetical protein